MYAELLKNLMTNHWKWDFAEFCRRCKFRADPKLPYSHIHSLTHAQNQWKAFRNLHEAMQDIDKEVFAVVTSEAKDETGVASALTATDPKGTT